MTEVSQILKLNKPRLRELDLVLKPTITPLKKGGKCHQRTYDPVVVEEVRLRREVSAALSASSNCYGGRTGTRGLARTPEVQKYPAFIRAMWTGHVSSCIRKDLENSLPIDDFVRIATGECRYCGEVPQLRGNGRGGKNTGLWNGIDRIDNGVGYVLENLVSCCKNCNMMKKNMGAEAFVKHCIKTAKYWGDVA